jgi:hypothetical protein
VQVSTQFIDDEHESRVVIYGAGQDNTEMVRGLHKENTEYIFYYPSSFFSLSSAGAWGYALGLASCIFGNTGGSGRVHFLDLSIFLEHRERGKELSCFFFESFGSCTFLSRKLESGTSGYTL